MQSQLSGTRTVILSRWDRPLRIVPDSEVAQRIVEIFGDKKVVMPSNVVTPSLRAELEKLGVPFKETNNQGKERYSISASVVATILDIYDNVQDVVGAVEGVIKKYPKESVMLENILEDYQNTTNDDKLIKDLKGYARTFADKAPKDYSADKAITEEKFGGIWIEDRQEFAKFVSATDRYSQERDAEGTTFTDNYFYAYYRNIYNQPIPYAAVYINENDSQDFVNTIIEKKSNGTKKGIRGYIDRAYVGTRNTNRKSNVVSSNNQEPQSSRGDDRLGGELLRLGRYYYSPELYSKVKRTDRGSENTSVKLSLKSLDIPYLDAVARGDMATARRLVQEAAEHAGYLPYTSYQGSLAFNGSAPTSNGV